MNFRYVPAIGLVFATTTLHADILAIDVTVPVSEYEITPGATFEDSEAVLTGTEETVGRLRYDDAEDLLAILEDDASLSSINENYSDGAEATVEFTYLDVPYTMSFLAEDSVVQVEAPGFSQEYTGGNRQEALNDFLTFLRENPEVPQRISIGNTPTNPVAGNPDSLQDTMVEQTYEAGVTSSDPQSLEIRDTPRAATRQDSGVYSLGARVGRYSIEGNDITVIELPLKWVRPLDDPRYGISLDFPLTYSRVNNVESYSAAVGMGLRTAVYDNWSLTPSARIGVVDSPKSGVRTGLAQAALSSRFVTELGATSIALGNLIAYSTSFDFSPREKNGVKIVTDHSNVVIRNGIQASRATSYQLFGQETTLRTSLTHTEITGDADVYIDSYTDFAVDWGTRASQNGIVYDSVRIGVTYTSGSNNYESFQVNLGYDF